MHRDNVETLYAHPHPSIFFRIFCIENEWFTGIVTAAISSEGTYDIAYDDGDSDEGLSDYCVHRLIN
jgi:hypothetical protein